MKVSLLYDIEDLNTIREVINSYNPKKIPVITTRINHIRIDDKAMIRLIIEGNDEDVNSLVERLD